jgi:hypothetical protein
MNKKLKMNYTQERNQIDCLPERRDNLLPEGVRQNTFFKKKKDRNKRGKDKAGKFK